MKQKDLLIIITAAIISGVVSVLISKYIFSAPKVYNLKSPKVDAITSDFKIPDSTYFNKQSIDLTKNITIGDSGNQTPFKGN